ncbi:hypothetical protein F1559_002445 [Cyanidiococcus yangmingshanensis]|uniref:Uncharacterized protein n=1 Tax=Cyanidiococcus yangmingshanensis TaxID=2690220 RepID=A0A7J7IR31_9RHOD|nr:hypothetical protein F1559_002445 [Cyanidiococcus yangmingshanensis]
MTVDVFDFKVSDSNQFAYIMNARNHSTLQRRKNRINQVPRSQICRAMRSLGRGATACIVLFLLERARSRAHWRQRFDAVRSLRWVCSLLARDELRPLFPGLASGLGSIILGDAQTRAVIIAEGALCFSVLLSKALSFDGSGTLEQVDFERSSWNIIPQENETFKAAGVPVGIQVESQASMEEKDNWVEIVRPRLRVLLRRTLVENNGSFSLHGHVSPLVQFAGARLCVEILIQLHKHETFAELIPMIFASLAYYLTSEHVDVATIVRKYLSCVEDSLKLKLAETALDRILEELEENPSKVSSVGMCQVKFLRFMAGLCGYLGQLHHAVAPLRLMQYFERNHRVLDILLAALDIEGEAGNQSIRLWKQCTDGTDSVQNAPASTTCYVELVYFLGSVGALDRFADYIIAMLESACADIAAVPVVKLMNLANRFMQGALSSPRATDEGALSVRSICVDILETYVTIGAKYSSMQNLVVQILQGIRVFAESNIVPVSDFSRIYMHKYLGFVASLSIQTRRTLEDTSNVMAQSVLKTGVIGSFADTKIVSRERASIVAVEAAECLCAIARAAGFPSVESLVGAQLSFLIDMVRDETALRFIFETAGAECLLIVRDEIICIARGVAFQTNERALRQLDLLDAICSLVSQHPLMKSQTIGNEDSGADEKQLIIIHFQQLLESICGAAIAALDRPIPMLRRAALKLLHTLLRSLAQRQELLLPVMAAVLDAVPRSVHQMPADVLIVACDVVEAAFEEAPWFATSRAGAIWSSFACFLPQPVGAKPHRTAMCNANINGKQFKLARGVTWAAIARILECLRIIPLGSLVQYEEAVRAACAAVQNFERIRGAPVGFDYSAVKSAAHALQSDLDQWKRDRTE